MDLGPEDILLLISRDPEKTARRLSEVKVVKSRWLFAAASRSPSRGSGSMVSRWFASMIVVLPALLRWDTACCGLGSSRCGPAPPSDFRLPSCLEVPLRDRSRHRLPHDPDPGLDERG
jgi:hypothetical protein